MSNEHPFHLVRTRPNIFGFSGLDRQGHLRHEDERLEALLAEPGANLVIVWRSRNLVMPTADQDEAGMDAILLPAADFAHLTEAPATLASLGHRADAAHIAVDLSHLDENEVLSHAPAGAMLGDLREMGGFLDHFEGSLLAYARGLMFWHQRHGFCGVCGSKTVAAKVGHQRDCTNPDCGAAHFPRTDPAVIMLVHDGDKALLGRQAVWPEGMYSTLAGFVEPGETLEEAVAREVFEESGVEVTDVRYHSSQPWPFPASIMLGFHAEAKSTDIVRKDDELADVGWFTKDEMRDFEAQGKRLPRPISIARRLIEDWLAE